jgi:hypothetical protein
MNILLWVLQVGLAVLYLAGGAYKAFKSDEVTKMSRTLSPGGWRAIGVIEMLGGVFLIVPASVSGMPMLTALTAALLALETLGLAGLYARRSVKLVAANPFTWAAAMGLLAAILAYGRYALTPLA